MLAVAAGVVAALPAAALSEQAAQPGWAAAGGLDAGRDHSCAVMGAGVRCWGFGGAGQLGYADTRTVGDDEGPGAAGPVDLGLGARQIGAGLAHSCALLDDASVRCWGLGIDGQLGYANTDSIGDNEAPVLAGPVDLGGNASAISAGGDHSCAVLEGGSVRCWGLGFHGQLGYGSIVRVGDDEPPADVAPVQIGAGRTATAISAGARHSCALLDGGDVRCWGSSGNGQLGYANTTAIGDNEDPGTVGPVNLGTGRTARAVSAGDYHTCALLDNATVRCWGFNFNGQLGYANTTSIGDDELPGSVGPVNLGPGRTAIAISAGAAHTCALLDDGSVRCWGYGADGRLGYASTADVGDNESPGSVGPVDLGGRAAVAISAGGRHTCARLSDGSVRCWGAGANGRLGICSARNIGDDEPPGSVGPIILTPPAGGGSGCPPAGVSSSSPAKASPPDPEAADLKAEAERLRGLRGCLAKVRAHGKREMRRARQLSGSRRARAIRHIRRHRRQLRRRCLKRWGRTPGRVTSLRVEPVSSTSVKLSFRAPGTADDGPPAARQYLVKLSRRPLRTGRAFRRADALCTGSCRFAGAHVGQTLTLAVRRLAPRTTYYLAVAARDNVSKRLGPRSLSVKVRTR